MHLDGSNPPKRGDLISTLRSFGLPVYITEMDVNMKDVLGTKEEREKTQADVYRMVLQSVLDSGTCKSISFWTIGDKYSWIETSPDYSQYSLNADPTPFDDDLKPKPAYYAVLDVLKAYAQKVNPGG